MVASRRGFSEDGKFADHTDHRPIWASFNVGTKMTKIEAKCKIKKTQNINREDSIELKKFQSKIIKEWMNKERTGDWEEEISKSAVKAYKKKLPKRRQKK